MRLWIDADAAPRDVKDVCLRAAERLKLETVLVANQRVQLTPGYAHVTAVRVDGGPMWPTATSSSTRSPATSR